MTKPTSKKSGSPKKSKAGAAKSPTATRAELQALANAVQQGFDQLTHQQQVIQGQGMAVWNVLNVVLAALKDKGLVRDELFKTQSEALYKAVMDHRAEQLAEIRSAKEEGREPREIPQPDGPLTAALKTIEAVSTAAREKATADYAAANPAKDSSDAETAP